MKRMAIIGLIILLGAGFAPAQSRRVPNYSESGAKNEKNQPQNETIQNGKTAAEKPKDDSDVIRVETDLVIIPTKIADRSGKIVANLKKEEFKIFENGIEQELAYFSNEEQPFTVALVLDMSFSSVFKIQEIQAAAFEFVRQLRPRDKVMVVSFDEEVRVLCEPTSDRRILRLAIEGSKIASGTSFYAALDLVLQEKFKAIAGRKAIVVLGDGVDTTSRKATAKNILEQIGDTDVLFFPIEYNTYEDVQKSRKENAQVFYDDDDRPVIVELPKVAGEREEDYNAAKKFLKEIAAQTGGRVYRVSSTTNLSRAFAEIADELRKIYSLGYYPSGDRKNGSRYSVKIRVYRPNLIVRAKDGYLWKRN